MGSFEEMSNKLVSGWGYEVEIEGEIEDIEIGLKLLVEVLGI